jgi:hypothetical protein
MRTTPARRMTLHFLQIGLIDARTFMVPLPRDRLARAPLIPSGR